METRCGGALQASSCDAPPAAGPGAAVTHRRGLVRTVAMGTLGKPVCPGVNFMAGIVMALQDFGTWKIVFPLSLPSSRSLGNEPCGIMGGPMSGLTLGQFALVPPRLEWKRAESVTLCPGGAGGSQKPWLPRGMGALLKWTRPPKLPAATCSLNRLCAA
ncbi:hypothetical protein SKAU_G00049160 [Synaphobranchus kaupii]|uniref:Uncharacterized protein n=1 Tax=Synaphobranchus kaupii TaxID=118154 RepID=A0A9Q1G334_SYNKA|nr:hypothetical protein SKAU_G00049160 [Synaphobranchus kaupii]